MEDTRHWLPVVTFKIKAMKLRLESRDDDDVATAKTVFELHLLKLNLIFQSGCFLHVCPLNCSDMGIIF